MQKSEKVLQTLRREVHHAHDAARRIALCVEPDAVELELLRLGYAAHLLKGSASARRYLRDHSSAKNAPQMAARIRFMDLATISVLLDHNAAVPQRRRIFLRARNSHASLATGRSGAARTPGRARRSHSIPRKS